MSAPYPPEMTAQDADRALLELALKRARRLGKLRRGTIAVFIILGGIVAVPLLLILAIGLRGWWRTIYKGLTDMDRDRGRPI